MKFKSKNVSIKTGDTFVCLMHIHDAKYIDVWPGDRLLIKKGKQKVITVIDITHKETIIRPGMLGIFKDVADELGTAEHDIIEIEVVEKPVSVAAIRKKLHGHQLKEKELRSIVRDIADRKLTNIEMTYFVSSCFMHDLSFSEIKYLTEAMVSTGDKLPRLAPQVYDKHCSGGVAGNRTTPIIVPIVASAGLVIPKTSSRSITSPAGTADTMEVMARVDFSISEMKKIVKQVGACITWGGALNLAPADDTLIHIERPLGIDSEGQMIASILAKKLAVSANRILIDLCISKKGKINKKVADRLKRKLLRLGRAFHVTIEVMFSQGDEPVGHGIGPALEARDVLWVLKGDPRGPEDLRKKAVYMAGKLLGMSKKFKKPYKKAEQLLASGQAFDMFRTIVTAQGIETIDPDELLIGPKSFHVKAKKKGKIKAISNELISRIAQGAGAPADKSAGIYLYKHVGDIVKKNELLYTVYAYSERKLEYARSLVTPLVIKIS